MRIDKESHRNSRTSSGKEKVDKIHQQEQQSREACISTNVHPIYLYVQAHRVGRLKSVDTIGKRERKSKTSRDQSTINYFFFFSLWLPHPFVILSFVFCLIPWLRARKSWISRTKPKPFFFNWQQQRLVGYTASDADDDPPWNHAPEDPSQHLSCHLTKETPCAWMDGQARNHF